MSMIFRYNINSQEYKFLELETDENDTGGAYIYYYTHINNVAYDNWYKSLNDAFESARLEFGIRKDQWKIIEK